MTKTKPRAGIPEKLLKMMQLAAEQRALYSKNPDPLTVSNPVTFDDPPPLSESELLDKCALEPETDIGNGRRLRIRHGSKLLHVTHVGWHGFDGARWLEDASGSVVRQFAHDTAEKIDDEAIRLDCSEDEKAAIESGRLAIEDMKKLGKAPKAGSGEDIAAYWQAFTDIEKRIEAMAAVQKARDGRMSSRHTFAKSSAGTNRINNMLAEAVPYCSKNVDDLNRDLYAVNVRTGTLRFFRSDADGKDQWRIRQDAHRSADFISKVAEVEFDPDASAPLFRRFFQQVIPDVEIRAFLRRYLGYCLLGITTEQCLLFFYGAGRNGKSTLVDLVVEILGDYAISMSIDSFAGDSKRAGAEATPDLARLPGARLVAASEPEMGVNLKDALIKSLTGGEAISVRRLHQDFFELKPQFKIILSGNHKPIIRDDSDGIWRRVHLVPFDIQIPESEVDPDLPLKLRQEKAGIFAWMVKGALEYLNEGLRPPDTIRAATAEYREESDPIGAFLRSGCEITGADVDATTPEEMYNGYCMFARREGLPEFKSSTFSRRLPLQTRKSWRGPDALMHMFRKGHSNGTLYYGVRVKPEFRGGQHPPRDDAGE